MLPALCGNIVGQQTAMPVSYGLTNNIQVVDYSSALSTGTSISSAMARLSLMATTSGRKDDNTWSAEQPHLLTRDRCRTRQARSLQNRWCDEGLWSNSEQDRRQIDSSIKYLIDVSSYTSFAIIRTCINRPRYAFMRHREPAKVLSESGEMCSA